MLFLNVNCWWSISHLQLWLFLWRNGFKWSGVSVSKNEQILFWWCCMFLLSSLQSPVCVYWAATQLNHWWGVFLKVEWPLVLLMDRPEVGKLMLATKATHKRSDWLIFCSFPRSTDYGRSIRWEGARCGQRGLCSGWYVIDLAGSCCILELLLNAVCSWWCVPAELLAPK